MVRFVAFAKLNLLANRIVFHEGPVNHHQRMRAAVSGQRPGAEKRFEDFTWAELSGCDNRGAKDVLKTALEPLFHKLQPGEQVRMVRLLDCDYSRTRSLNQGQSRKSTGGVPPRTGRDMEPPQHRVAVPQTECLTSWIDAALPSGSRPVSLIVQRCSRW